VACRSQSSTKLSTAWTRRRSAPARISCGISGLEVYYLLQKANSWINYYLPNAFWSDNYQGYTPPAYPRRWLELPLGTTLGNHLEQWEMRRKIRKFGGQETAESDFSADWCKGHFDEHARRILDNFDKRVQVIKKEEVGE
jgi:hypothetical protein